MINEVEFFTSQVMIGQTEEEVEHYLDFTRDLSTAFKFEDAIKETKANPLDLNYTKNEEMTSY